MAGFADAFSAENIGNLMNDPRMLMGLAMMQQSGPQAGNPGFGQRFGQAGLGAMQQMLNRQTGEYEDFGKPFNQFSPGHKAKAASPADDVTDAILGAEPPAAGADASSLPGTGGLADFAPQPQQPVGIFPMAAQGGGLAAKKPTQAKPAVDDNLKAAGAAIAAGKSRQAVVSRLMQAGYTAEQIQAAGI